jgi:transcriptional regulator of heat shock response
MMTERQSEILNRVVREYVRMAQPVSSQFLREKKVLAVSSATIRNEMQRLTDEGYLFQPHTSAGRVPTDKGYRFFVDSLLEREIREMKVEMEERFENAIRFTHELTRFLAEHSSSLALGYLPEEKILWREGWGEIFREPEFREKDAAVRFARMLEDFERGIDEMLFEEGSAIKVYIGRENPFSKTRDFGLVIGQCCFPKKEKGFLVIAGPKRMAYDKNITLMDSVIKFLNNC